MVIRKKKSGLFSLSVPEVVTSTERVPIEKHQKKTFRLPPLSEGSLGKMTSLVSLHLEKAHVFTSLSVPVGTSAPLREAF